MREFHACSQLSNKRQLISVLDLYTLLLMLTGSARVSWRGLFTIFEQLTSTESFTESAVSSVSRASVADGYEKESESRKSEGRGGPEQQQQQGPECARGMLSFGC